MSGSFSSEVRTTTCAKKSSISGGNSFDFFLHKFSVFIVRKAVKKWQCRRRKLKKSKARVNIVSKDGKDLGGL